MEKPSNEVLKEFINNRNCASTTDNSMKELFSGLVSNQLSIMFADRETA